MVPVNFSVCSEGNATWVILATTSTRRGSRKILHVFAVRKTQPEKLLHISEVTGCCFILSFQGLEDSKGFINGITSKIILLDTFAVTLHEGCRLSSLRPEHDDCY